MENLDNRRYRGDRLKRSVGIGLALKSIVTNLTVEPVIFLKSFCHGLTQVTEDQILIYKSCRVDFNATDETCHDLFADQNKHLNEMINDKVCLLPTFLVKVVASEAALLMRRTCRDCVITGDPAKCVEHNVEKHHIAMRLPLHWYPDRYFGSEDHNVHFSNRFIGDLCTGRAKLSVSALAERIDFDYQRASVSGRWLRLLAYGLIHLCIR